MSQAGLTAALLALLLAGSGLRRLGVRQNAPPLRATTVGGSWLPDGLEHSSSGRRRVRAKAFDETGGQRRQEGSPGGFTPGIGPRMSQRLGSS